MRLHELKPAPGSRPHRIIVGRGEGSTLGQTCGKGQKGQSCRSGDTIMLGFEGGQTPMVRRIPKRGFRHASKIYFHPISVGVLEKAFEANAEISGAGLFEKGFLKKADLPFKILGSAKVTKAFKISAPAFSKSAEEAIKAAGGQISKAS